MSKSIVCMVLGLLLTLVGISGPALASVQATLDRPVIREGETVQLRITLDETETQDPILTDLHHDFQILGENVHRQIQLINGRQQVQVQWSIQLLPRRSGELFIPPLQVGSNRTDRLRLMVRELSPDQSQELAEQIFLQVVVEPDNPYVQSQLRLTLRLYYAVPLLEGQLEEPELENAVVERLSEDITYTTSHKGRRYRVVERHYALFPERSGPLVIPALNFRGRIAEDSDSRTALFSVHRGRPVALTSEPLSVEIKPQPEQFQGDHWLPSSGLSLEEQWQGKPTFRVGEPVTRTLVLKAKGLSAAHLPLLDLPEQPDWKHYQEKVVSDDLSDGATIVGNQRQQMALIPTRAGILTLPEIRLPWWDTTTDSPQVATLPARTITVAPAIPTTAAPPPTVTPAAPSAVSTTPDSPPAPRLTWAWSVVLAVGLLGLWWPLHRQRRGVHPRQLLQQACRRNDPELAAQALLHWAEQQWPTDPPKNLNQLANRLGGDTAPLLDLNRVLYAPQRPIWEGKALWQRLRRGLETPASASAPAQQLAPLYPPRS